MISSCYKDNVLVDNTDIVGKKYPKIDVNAEIVGKVHDEYGNDIVGYTGTILNNAYDATKSPYYHFSVVDANKNGSLLTINYDNGDYQFLVKPIGNDVNYFSHTIITKPGVLQKSSETNVNENLQEGVHLKIAGGSYLTGNTDYSGEVVIKSFVPDLTNPNHLEALPGGHLALDSGNNDIWLNYSKVVFLSFETDDNSPLEISKGNAKLSIENVDCEDCSVWYYDDKMHIWQYYSKINSTDKVEFEVSHSGFYTLAAPYVFNLVEGSVFIGKKPLVNQAVDLFFEDRLVERVYTTNTGKWFTHLPIDHPFKYKVDVECNEKFEEEFKIKGKDETISPMVLSSKLIPSININGVVKDCSNEEIERNFFKVLQGEKSGYYFFDSPKINLEVPYCSNTILKIQSADENWENIGPQLVFDVFVGTVDFKNLYTCNQIVQDGYFNLNIEGKEKLFRITESKIKDNRTELLVYDNENIDAEFLLLFSGQEAREYRDDELNMFFKNLEIDDNIYEFNCSTSTIGCGFEKFKITDFGEKKGDWIRGVFEGNFWVKSYNPLHAGYKRIKGDFLVKRNFK